MANCDYISNELYLTADIPSRSNHQWYLGWQGNIVFAYYVAPDGISSMTSVKATYNGQPARIAGLN